MADRGFLRPRSVDDPAQGDFLYLPRVFTYEADTAAALADEMNIGAGIQSQDTDWYWVIEDIEYQTTVLSQELGMQPAVLKYSALVWATQVIKN